MDAGGGGAFAASRGLYETNTRSPWLVIQRSAVTLGKVGTGKACPPKAKALQISPGEG